MNDGDFNRPAGIAAPRRLFADCSATTRLHLGANFQHRVNNRDALEPATTSARPTTQLTDQRFIDTGTLAAKGDDIFGLEAAAIFKQFHVAGRSAEGLGAQRL